VQIEICQFTFLKYFHYHAKRDSGLGVRAPVVRGSGSSGSGFGLQWFGVRVRVRVPVVRLFGFQWFGVRGSGSGFGVRVRGSGSVDLKQKKGRVNCGLGSGFGGSSIFYLDICIESQEHKKETISREEK
jgi:hypothetical protein